MDTTMLTLAIVAVLTGGALGLCFRVLVLVPTSLCAIGLVALAGVASRSSIGLMAEQALLVFLMLQAGYCLGLATRHLTVVVRSPILRKATASARRARLSASDRASV